MKAIGLASAGIGAASLVAPVFHDLDELISSDSAGWQRPWWIKQKDEPTVEIDWSQIKPYDHRLIGFAAYANAQHWGLDRWKEVIAQGPAKTASLKGTKGWRIREMALSQAGTPFADWRTKNAEFMGFSTVTPETLGLPKWQGSPEENTRMIRAAAIIEGATQISTTELGSNERNLVYTYGRQGILGMSTEDQFMTKWPPPAGYWHKYEFRNVDIGYTAPVDGVDGVLCVLPDRPLYDISVMIPMAKEAWRTTSDDQKSSAMIGSEANAARYRMFHTSTLPGIQTFIKAIGYHSYAYAKNDTAGGCLPSEASAVLGGISEMSRSSEICINPEYGPVTGYYSILTDLPMASLKPIDAGIFRFCHSCRKCADYCPSGSISFDKEPSWEIPNFDYKVKNMCLAPGKKLFWIDITKCQSSRQYINQCSFLCRGVCSFNVNNTALIHEAVHVTASTTGVFNGFFYNMSKAFGYGPLDPDDWWSMASNLPTWGTFPTQNTTRGI